MNPDWSETEFDGVPLVPKSTDPKDIAVFVDKRVRAGNRMMLRRITQHFDQRFNELQIAMMGAFPEGDLPAHHAYHARQIATARVFGKLKYHVAATVLGTIALGACAAVGWAILEYVLRLIGRGIP